MGNEDGSFEMACSVTLGTSTSNRPAPSLPPCPSHDTRRLEMRRVPVPSALLRPP